MAVLGEENYNSFSDIKEGKNVKVGIFLLISYIRNTGENMKIEKIIIFLYPKNCCNIWVRFLPFLTHFSKIP
jgi:hypothetical protein